LTTSHVAYTTPLGEIPIAHAQLDRLQVELAEHSSLELEYIRNDSEHAIEIELPFLQRVLREGFQLLPIMIRDQTLTTARSVGHALASVLREEESLLVASTDLSHGYPQETARKLDSEMIARLEAFDPDAVLEAEVNGVGFACGRAAVAAVLWAARDLGADRVQLLDYATSGDVTGDYREVVGYGAAAILRTENK
jgi:AmmeMemoRadiSam system protein B